MTAKSLKIKPINKRILVEALKERTTKSGIVLSENNELTSFGTVIEVADDIKEFEVGDKLIYDKYAVDTIETDGDTFLLIHINDIIAKIIE